MPIEILDRTFCAMAIVMYVLPVTVYEILAVEMRSLQNATRSNVYTPVERPRVIFHMVVIVTFAFSVTIYKIVAIWMCTTLTLTFRVVQGQM